MKQLRFREAKCIQGHRSSEWYNPNSGPCSSVSSIHRNSNIERYYGINQLHTRDSAIGLTLPFSIFSKEEWWRHTVLAAWMAELKRFKQYPQGCGLLTWNWESASITSYNGWWQKMGRKEERLEMLGTTELLHSTEESLQWSAVPAASTVHWAPEDSGEHWVQPLPGPHRDCNTGFSLSTTELWGALSTASLQGAVGIQTVFLIYHHYDKCLVSSP